MRHVCERIALLFVISWGAWAQSSSEDIMFKGFPLGGSIEDFKQRFPDTGLSMHRQELLFL